MDLYDLLGVRPDADVDDIKRAYRRLARRLHPDINPGDAVAAVRFRAVVEAYETLSDPVRRLEYDQRGLVGAAAVASVTFGFEGFDFSGTAPRGAEGSTFGDLFADVIQDSVGGGAAPEDGADLHVSISVRFVEMLHGAERVLPVVRRDTCQACRGTGSIPVSESTCPACVGTGSLRTTRGRMVFAKACPRCNGSGTQRRAPCHLCGGDGAASRGETLSITIPPGVHDGERLCMPGCGHAGLRGGRAGDLYVSVTVEPHPLFRRDGDDLLLTVPVAVHEAALGSRFDIPTPDGPVRLRVPPSTPAGQRFRLRERGIPSLHDGRRGDLIVEIRLVLPAVLDERSKELLREFGTLQTEDVRGEVWRQLVDESGKGTGGAW
jgi:molecular chaperone DnaJ